MQSRTRRMPHDVLSTPVVVVSLPKLQSNIRDMAENVKKAGKKIRPHFKAHKIIPLARMQKDAGAVGFTSAKLSEARVLIEAGFDDILIAYPLWGKDKIDRFFNLGHRARVSTIIDSFESLDQWSTAAADRGKKVTAYVKVDTGLNRVGYPPGDKLIRLCESISKQRWIHFKGLLTHAGHAYGARDQHEREKIGTYEGMALTQIKEALLDMGIAVDQISVGSTPTVKYNLETPAVTEVRPGNYVFNDANQLAMGVADQNHCALWVETTVVAAPAQNRRIIDAGSKVLALDRGAHGTELIKGFGVVDAPGWTLTRLSEEHGVLERKEKDELWTDIPVGSRLKIIPNHACTVINLTDRVVLVDGAGTPLEIWPVDARGCSR